MGWWGADVRCQKKHVGTYTMYCHLQGHFLEGSIFGLESRLRFICHFHGGVCVECGWANDGMGAMEWCVVVYK